MCPSLINVSKDSGLNIAVSEAVAGAAVGAPRDFDPRTAFYSLASDALDAALEAVRQDSLTHELLEAACARLEELPRLAAADPLQGLPCAVPSTP